MCLGTNGNEMKVGLYWTTHFQRGYILLSPLCCLARKKFHLNDDEDAKSDPPDDLHYFQ